MSENDERPSEKSTTEKLAALVAKRKAGLNAGAAGGAHNGRRGSERTAAALSASKSKPALRK